MMDLDKARGICLTFGMDATRENIRRVVRAKSLVESGHVRFRESDGYLKVYDVLSQWDRGVYAVRVNGDLYPTCTCEDWRKANALTPSHLPICTHRCKHGLAVMMSERGHLSEAKPPLTVTIKADKVTSLECRYISVWFFGKMISLDSKHVQVDGDMVTMPKHLAERHGIDTRFDPERPEYTDDPKFDEKIFHEAISQWKEAMLTSMYQ